jgi:hypothetical protein
MDETFVKLTPGPTIETPPAVVQARRQITDAAARLVAVPDSALESSWKWRDRDLDVRSGFFRGYEALEEASAAVRRALDEADVAPAPAARHAARSTVARWDLHGVLTSLGDGDLDREPGGDEWTIRQTLAHIVNAQRAYAWYTAWWLARAGQPLLPQVPDDALPEFPDEESEGRGSLAEIRSRLDSILDLAIGRFGALGDAELAVPARWSGYALTVGFRLGRWASHLREHTIQVDKTLLMIGRSTREVDRLVRLLLNAYGDLEAAVFGLPAAALDRPGADGRTPAAIIATVTDGVAAEASGIEAAAASAGSAAGRSPV